MNRGSQCRKKMLDMLDVNIPYFLVFLQVLIAHVNKINAQNSDAQNTFIFSRHSLILLQN